MNGMQFRASRLALGMTQSELADAMDLTNDTISRMERFAERIDKRTELAISMLLSNVQIRQNVERLMIRQKSKFDKMSRTNTSRYSLS